ncbi:MAG: hypothetical protein R3251_04560 [Candidatus Spechtbacterales bacterium]|nr:hypothetical protein [Candidatus Spechtbacterales bacterium]
MAYFYTALILLATTGIGYVVFKYYNPLDVVRRRNNAKIGGIKGEEFWLNLIKDNPKNPYPYKKLGEWYARNNQQNEAIEVLAYAVKLDPSDGNVKKQLADLRE